MSNLLVDLSQNDIHISLTDMWIVSAQGVHNHFSR
jgi:hypothetical protein